MKRTLVIEIEGPSSFPMVVNEEKEQIPVGLDCRVFATDDDSLWAGATWQGKVVSVTTT